MSLYAGIIKELTELQDVAKEQLWQGRWPSETAGRILVDRIDTVQKALDIIDKHQHKEDDDDDGA